MKKKIAITILVGLGLFLGFSVLGAENWALKFDGIDDYVLIPDNESLNFGTGDFKIEVLFEKIEMTNSYGSFIFKSDDDWETQGWQGAFQEYEEAIIFSIWDFDWTNYIELQIPTSGVINGNEHHFVLLKESDKVEIWLDDVLIGEESGANLIGSISNNQDLRIGTNGLEFFKGIIDEIKIWKGIELTGYWNFNKGEGNILYDLSGYENNGIIYGATWQDLTPPLPPPIPFLELTDSFPAGIIGYVRSFLGSGLSPFIAMIIGIPLAFVVIKRVIGLIPKEEKGYFKSGGFEKDPSLTEKDKRYYREKYKK